MKTFACTLLLLAMIVPHVVQADDKEGIQFFEQKIRPVLVERCYGCHSTAARDAKELQGGLFLDSAAGIAAGGELGAVLVKAKSTASSLGWAN